jgi:hypothetical protein
MVLVTGEVGLGKPTLVEAFLRALGGREWYAPAPHRGDRCKTPQLLQTARVHSAFARAIGKRRLCIPPYPQSLFCDMCAM